MRALRSLLQFEFLSSNLDWKSAYRIGFIVHDWGTKGIGLLAPIFLIDWFSYNSALSRFGMTIQLPTVKIESFGRNLS
jgi:hypothetical protein